MNHYIKITILFLIFLSSCSKKQTDIVISKNFSNEEWARFDYLKGEFEIRKVPTVCNIVLEITVSEVYPNIYPYHRDDGSFLFNMTIKNPENDGFRSKDYRFSLKDKEGNWKANKVDGYYTFYLPIINGITFSETGVYSFIMENKYTKDPLFGIKNLTLKCIYAK